MLGMDKMTISCHNIFLVFDLLRDFRPLPWLDLDSIPLQHMVEQKKGAMYYTNGSVYQYGGLLSINVFYD